MYYGGVKAFRFDLSWDSLELARDLCTIYSHLQKGMHSTLFLALGYCPACKSDNTCSCIRICRPLMHTEKGL